MTQRAFLAAGLAVLATAQALAVDVWFSSAPSSVQTGHSYYVEAAAYSWSGGCDLYVDKNGSYFTGSSGYNPYAGNWTTDYGAQTVEYRAEAWDWYDYSYNYSYAWVTITPPPNNAPTITWTSAPSSSPVNQWFYIQARGNDSDGNLTNVDIWRDWTPHAFAGGGNGYEGYSGNGAIWGSAGTLTFMARATDSNGAQSDFIYHQVQIYVPNVAPTITWVNNPPSSVYVNQWFNMQARANDGNGNLTWINVWRDDQPFAFNGGGNGWEAYSDNNGAVGTYPYTTVFKAKAGDSSGAESGFIYHNVTVVNRAPHSPTISASGPGVTWNSTYGHYIWWNTDPNPITVTTGLQDADGNLVHHGVYAQRVAGAAPDPGGWVQQGSGTPSNGSNSTKVITHSPPLTGRWDYHINGHDGYAWSSGNSITVWVYGQQNGAQLVSQSVSTAPMEIGSTRQVSVTFRNTGTKPWTRESSDAYHHRLGSYTGGPWGIDRVHLNANEIVNPGADRTFTFTITAPTTAGTRTFQWRMLEEGLEWFGDLPAAVQIPVVDSNAPSAPTSLTLTGKTHTSASLSWGGSTDPAPGQVLHYRVYRNGSLVGTPPGLSFDDNGLTPNTAYSYVVRAWDGSNESPASNTLNVTTNLDPAGDQDQDGMTNGWESANNLNPNLAADASLDPDGDGWSNIAEFNRQTNPQSYNAGTSTLGNGIPAGWTLGDANPSVAVGTTTGQLSVDKSGALTYSVPIWTTPGTAGMQPQVSLNYSSQAGNGIAGFGWSIGGVSAITRGPKTKAIDGSNRGVTLTADDRFYLDGQRLIQIGDGTYRTELDSITKVVAHGSAGSGPAWFQAWTKSGLIIEFGNTGDSAFDAYGKPEKLSWHVNKISDTKGNYMTFEYAENAANGEHRLTRINYTGNGVVAPYASLRFEYENRTDWSSGYVVGSPVSSLQRLKYIRSYFGESAARTYTLGYTEAQFTGRSVLSTLTEAGSDGKAYLPLQFDYEANDHGWDDGSAFLPLPYYLADNSNQGRAAGSGFVDLDGDGRTDFVARRDGVGVNVAKRNTGSGWADFPAGTNFTLPYKLADSSTAEDQGSRFVDLNGDGLVDFAWKRIGSGGNDLGNGAVLNTGTGWSSAPQWIVPAPIAKDGEGLRSGRFLDVNGDGRVDYVAMLTPGGGNNDELDVYLNNGNGWDSAHPGYSVMSTNLALAKARFVDLNGDGLVDIAAYYHGSGTTIQAAYLNTGSGWVYSSSYHPPQLIADNTNSSIGAEFVDANGDGLPDLLWYREVGAGQQRGVAINTGQSWYVPTVGSDLYNRYAPPTPLSRDNYFNAGGAFIDANLDGMPDILFSRQFTSQPAEFSVFYGNLRNWGHAGTGAAHELPHLLLQDGVAQVGADFVDLNGDGAVDVLWNRRHNSNPLTEFSAARLNKSRPIHGRLKKVTNGLGVEASVTYASLLDPSVYTKAANNDDLVDYMSATERAKVVNITGPMYVVRNVVNDNGAGGTHTLTYSYAKLRSHLDRGSLGFGWMKVHDTHADRNIHTQTTFRQDYPFIGQARHVKVTRDSENGSPLSESTTTWAEKSLNSGATRLIYASSAQEKAHDLGTGALYLTTTTTTGVPDDHSNVTSIVVETSDGFKKTTTNAYFPADTANWILGRLQTATVLSEASGEAPATRSSTFTYEPVSGLLKTETVEPNDDRFRLTTTYTYDQFGNKTAVEVRGKSLTVDNNGNYTVGADTSRTTTTQYDTRGRFPEYTTNALGHSEDYDHDDVKGVMTVLVGANDLATSWEYDGFGRKTRETRADLTVTETRYRWTPSGYLTDSKYFIETESTGSAPSRTHHDKLGRARSSQSINGDGKIAYQETRYDSLGRTWMSSVPYFNDGQPVYWTTTTYDRLDRPFQVTTPDDENGPQTSTYGYNGLSGTVTDPKGRVTETVKNSQGWTLSNTRNKNAGGGAADYTSVSYFYDALGNLKSTNAAGVVTTIAYDVRGRKESMVDADMGTWAYRYNVFGELIWQKDAKNQIVRLTYDNLGRLTQRVETEGTTTWAYDTSPTKGLGKLHTVTAPGSYAETHLYDSLGRPKTVTRTIDGIAYTFETGYDGAGRANRLIYPATGLSGSPFSTRNVFNDYGYLKEVRLWIDTDTGKPNSQLQGKVYWMADSFHVSGRVDGELHGNGVASDRFYSKATGRLRSANVAKASVVASPFAIQELVYEYDAVGNVKRRWDAAPGVNRDERFSFADGGDGYDGLDRLKVHRIVGGATVTVTYDQKGNISNKSDVGNYTYSQVNAGPHAVTSAGVLSYQYDANGNMYFGGGRTVEWTTFNQAKKITDNASGKNSEFFFGAGRERVKQLRKNGTTLIDTTIYVGSAYEKITSAASGLVEHKHYILGPTGRIAVFTDRSDFTKDTRYFHTDGLGSITVVTDEKGQVLKRYAYDAWGKQSTLYTNTGSGITNQAPTTRGFTGHEMLSDVGLVHMNGRVYDPALGRFLSADPFVGNASDPQEYNRYSYICNNPLGGTDPTGYLSVKSLISEVIGNIVRFVVFYFTGNAELANTAGNIASAVANSLLNDKSVNPAFQTRPIDFQKNYVRGSDALTWRERVGAITEGLKEGGSDVVKAFQSVADGLGETAGAMSVDFGGTIRDIHDQLTTNIAEGVILAQETTIADIKRDVVEAADLYVNDREFRQQVTNGLAGAGVGIATGGPLARVRTLKRLPQDIDVSPTPPPARPVHRPIGNSPTQNAAAQREIARLQKEGYTDIRVNQQQVNASGQRVGINRPDIQATSPSGKRVYIEFETPSSTRGPGHRERILANDPDGHVDIRIEK